MEIKIVEEIELFGINFSIILLPQGFSYFYENFVVKKSKI